jgi:biotin carboxyl carrier protein
VIYEVTVAGKVHKVELTRTESNWLCKLDGRELPLDVVSTRNGVLSLLLEGRSYEIKQEQTAGETNIVVGNHRFNANVRDPRSLRSRRASETGAQGVRKITAPMPGKVVRILVSVGEPLEAGQPVLVIEAMKMQNELKSPKKGVLKKVNVIPGAAVEAGQALAEVE